MPKLRPVPPIVAMARLPPTALSSLEHLLLGEGKGESVNMLTHIWHTRFLHTNPGDHLAILLPTSSLLALRVASSTTKDWVEEHHPELLQRLCVTCPLPRFPLHVGSTFRYLARNCTDLTIKILPSDLCTELITAATQIFDIVKGFSTLRIEPPSTNPFHVLLSIRTALEIKDLPKCTGMHFEPLDSAGLMSLRWGTFSSPMIPEWTSEDDEGSIFSTLKSVRLGMRVAEFTLKPNDPTIGLTMERIRGLKKERSLYRRSVMCLHDYFYEFARNGRLEKVHFEWIDGTGLNPLLVDEEVAKQKNGWKWFSAPGTTWQGLKEVWLGGAKVAASDVNTMKDRMEGLERLFVWKDEAAARMEGKVMFVDGKEWLEVDLDAASLRMPGPLHATECDDDGETLVNDDDDDSCSMIVPFVLQLPVPGNEETLGRLISALAREPHAIRYSGPIVVR